MWNGTMFVRLIKLGCLELWKERTGDEYLKRLDDIQEWRNMDMYSKEAQFVG